ncbi:NAD-dependent epimerase [Tardibacter chloracetimidivorans]|uniref:NAD-dependent epimerase n=1 Tax=Tardibacter chloracetimidivorans TaxID=1921510 RepID=A0A1L3ZYD0_9SPHN|nr:NAD-dependent epimerase/dehydratase family protein [Tardibacter chloracetimidivorans]API60632.1 NAD-dependent epimerase [Tardibacter chloracetimidivorans]
MSEFLSKRVLITGGLGFIGSNLARRLVGLGADVTLVDSLIPQYGGNFQNIADIRDRLTVNICDVRDPFAIEHLVREQHFLFNLAGQTSHLDSMTDPQTDLDINASAQLSLLEACRKANPGIRLVFASTRQLYGRPDYLPVDEKHPIRPVDVNGINKLAGEGYHLLYSNVYDIRASVLRLTNTYGPGMRVVDARQTFLGIWIRQLIEGSAIKVFGDGLQLRDFNFVDDCVDALLLAATNEAAIGQVYNLGSREVVNLKSLAELMIQMVAGGRFEIVPFPADRKAIDIGDYYSDFSAIERDLEWTPKVDLKTGLAQTIAYYQQHHAHYWNAST